MHEIMMLTPKNEKLSNIPSPEISSWTPKQAETATSKLNCIEWNVHKNHISDSLASPFGPGNLEQWHLRLTERPEHCFSKELTLIFCGTGGNFTLLLSFKTRAWNSSSNSSIPPSIFSPSSSAHSGQLIFPVLLWWRSVFQEIPLTSQPELPWTLAGRIRELSAHELHQADTRAPPGPQLVEHAPVPGLPGWSVVSKRKLHKCRTILVRSLSARCV